MKAIRFGFSYLIFLTGVLLCSVALADDTVGTLPGSFSVSPSGAATYTIPIEVPPGINGMQPDLAFVYNSQSGNGEMGVGWGLSGLSSITRCPTTLEEDGFIDGVDYDANDLFCLDGQRLTLESGLHGSPGAIYKAESVVKIEVMGSAGGSAAFNPGYFKVFGKDGRITYYGANEGGQTVDSRIYQAGSVNIYSWGVKTEQDNFGNTADYQYLNINDMHRIYNIIYSNYEVYFDFELRTDNELIVLAPNTRLLIDSRIKNIQIKVAGRNEKIFDYPVTYDYIAEESVLTGVSRCGLSCLPYTNFDWVSFNPDFFSASTTNIDTYAGGATNGATDFDAAEFENSRIKFGDFNGDGIIDVYTVNGWLSSDFDTVYLSQIGGTFSKITTNVDTYAGGATNGVTDFEVAKYEMSRIHLGDFNGDGLTDVYRINGWGAADIDTIYFSNGDGTFIKAYTNTGIYAGGESFEAARFEMSRVKFGDFNGDGMTDIYQVNGWGNSAFDTIYFSEGNGNFTTAYTNVDTYAGGSSFEAARFEMGRIFLGDFNGDGITDVYRVNGWGGTSFDTVYLSEGNGNFEKKSTNVDTYAGGVSFETANFEMSRIKFGDFNGDGRTDIYTVNGWLSSDFDTVYISQGDGSFSKITTNADTYAGGVANGDSAFEIADFEMSRIKLGDFNGDGRTDVYRINGWGSADYDTVYFSRGDGTFDKNSPNINMYAGGASFEAARFEMARVNLGDFNGDGRTDVYRVNGWLSTEHDTIYMSSTDRIRIQKIEGGIGSTVNIESQLLTSTSAYIKENSSQYPIFDYQGPLQVVTSVKTDNGLGGTNETTYAYEGMKIHRRGLGSLGFNKVHTTNQQTGFTNTTTYSQDWENRTVGMIKESLSKTASGTVLSHSINDLANRYDGIYSDRFMPYVTRSTSVSRDLNGQFTGTVTVESTLDSAGKLTDSYACHSATDYSVNQQLANTVSCATIGVGERYKHTQLDYYNDAYVAGRPGLLSAKTITTTVPNTPPYQSTTVTQEIAYDYHTDQGGLLKSQTVEPNNPDLQLKTEYTYYANGLPDTQTVSGYDLASNTTKFYYNSNGTLDSRTEGYGNQNISNYFFYDDLRFPWLVTGTRDPSTPSGFTTQAAFDSFGRAFQTTDRLGVVKQTNRQWCEDTSACDVSSGESYIETVSLTGAADNSVIFDTLGREVRRTGVGLQDGIPSPITQTTRYNAQGLVEFKSVPYYDGDASTIGITTLYDALGRITSSTDANNRQSTVAYSGLQMTYTNALLQTKQEIKNSLGQLVEVLDNAANDIQYQYDGLGKLVWLQDSEGNTTTMGYNARGFKTKMLDPDKGLLEYSYDGAGRIRTQKDNKGQISETSYDNLGRKITRIDDRDGSPTTNTWIYNTSGQHLGKLASVSGNGLTENYAYDGDSRLYQTTTTVDGNSYTSSRSFDSLGRVATLTYPGSALQLSYQYETTTGALLKLKDAVNDQTYWQANHQNASGAIEGFSLGDQLDVSVNHDAGTGLVDSIFAMHGATNLVAQTYAYDDIGNLTDRHDTVNDVHDQYYYDNLNRLTSNNAFRNYGGAAIAQQDLSYDALGNINTKSDVEGGALYEYGGAGCSNSNQTCAHAVAKIGSKSFFYDANGNMTSGWGRTIQYNAFNKPTYIEKDGKSTAFSYGPTQRRYKRVDSGGSNPSTTYYVQGLIEVVTGSVTKTKHHIGDFAVVTKQSGQADQTRYFLKDQLGSLVAIADENGNKVEDFNFDPWGKRRHVGGDFMDEIEYFSFASSLITNRGFTGHEHLDDVGLIHMNGRVFDPVIARFLSADPIIQAPTNLQSLNRYSYVLNNPLKYTDPSGFSAWSRGKKSLKKKWKKIRRKVEVALEIFTLYMIPGVGPTLAAFHPTVRNERRRLLQRKDMQRFMAAAPILCGPYAPACAAVVTGAGTTMVADAEGATPLQALEMGARAGTGAYIMAVAGGGNRGGDAYGNNWVQTSIVMGVAGGVNASINGGNFNDGFKVSATLSLLRSAHHEGREALNNGETTVGAAEQVMDEVLSDKEKLSHALGVDVSIVRKFVSKKLLFSSESIFHRGVFMDGGLNGGTWNVIAFSGWESFKVASISSWFTGATTLAGHTTFDIVPWLLWGNDAQTPGYFNPNNVADNYQRI